MPRVSFPVDEDLFKKLNSFMTWGVKAEVYRAISRNLVDTVDLLGPGVIGLIINGKFNLLTKQLETEKGGEST